MKIRLFGDRKAIPRNSATTEYNDEQENRQKDFDWALGVNRFTLRLIGVWPDESCRSWGRFWRVPLMIFFMLFGLFLPQMYALTIVRELPLLLENIVTSCPTLTSCVKVFFIWRNKLALEPVISSVTRDYLRPKSSVEDSTMRQAAYQGRFVTIADYTMMTTCFLGFNLMPLLGFNVRTITNLTDYGDHYLVVQSYFPYDYSRNPAYELTRMIQLAGSASVGMSICISDDYFCALLFHASAQFEILGMQIQGLSTIEGREQGRRRTDVRAIGALVERHVHLNKMVSLVQQVFHSVMAAQMFCMYVMVCCLGFQVLGMLDTSLQKPTPVQIFTLAGTLFTMLLHTFVDCFASEKLASQSSEVLFRIYSCNWYVLSSDQMRCFVPMMMMARNPRQIMIGKIFPMSMVTYCSIIKSTAGYISMLIAVSGR